ncbi:hypothetical protein AMIS_9000 [Actinoplanes missouriensis 431]|uniref:Fimbrial assembly protein n=1 Tax=Actinoplanes missouriensis (strain ATCC 14538 / DSM 43046 / CBS 188.64 / JCM 3121 / NBRC 102363 / NCIMB 12654 / NRRL B-3342 / UNCC 431) TaxID=512565 RepID=I0GZD3_ACTM4|nr:hypothetical protein [Actinoplanes missouriensis]BAL86120.1 hypothetical protein AMIS_9000 [Actinoplanes missouriensis 431]
MTTVLMPVDPSVSPQQAARVLSIRADLLPPEIRDNRRARRTRGFILVSLALVLALLGSWYWYAVQDLDEARALNDAAFTQLTDVRRDQQQNERVQALIKVENGQALLTKELTAVLGNDLSWANLINLVLDKADDHDVTINEITPSLNNENTGTTEVSGTVGEVLLTGKAKTKKIIADYLDALADTKDLSKPFVSTITDDTKAASFSISLYITDEALCGRFVDDDHLCPSEGK